MKLIFSLIFVSKWKQFGFSDVSFPSSHREKQPNNIYFPFPKSPKPKTIIEDLIEAVSSWSS